MNTAIFKSFLIIPLVLLFTNCYAQMNYELGYTGAWLYSRPGVAGGISFYAGRNIIQSQNTSLSLSTDVKIGLQDKAGTGLVIPCIVLLAYLADAGNTANNINNAASGDVSGGTIHLFADIPLLLHFNFGMGAINKNRKTFGFYLGGGITYIRTGYTDTLGYSRGAGFFGYVADGGVRMVAWRRNIDINVSNIISLQRPVGQINNPVMTEVTLSLMLEHNKSRKHRHR